MRKLAEDIYSVYMESIRSATPHRRASTQPVRLTCDRCDLSFFAHSYANKLCERCRGKKVAKSRSFDDLKPADKKSFRAAARVCDELGAPARDFVVAQFAAWREASAYHKKVLWPQPHNLAGLAAHVRYVQHQARQSERLARVFEVEEQDDAQRWYVEERTLKGLARVQRRDPVEVLAEQPEAFSREFLKHRGVWGVVKDLWTERRS